MMIPRSTRVLFESLDLMLDAAIRDHKNHESRNRQLSVIRAILDYWIKDYNRYTSSDDEAMLARQTLEACYQLCIWQLDGETHSCVKERLYLARNLISQYHRRVEEARQKAREMWRSEMPEPQEPEPIPDEALRITQPLDDLPF